jgi:alpha-glucuronidase
MAGVANTGSDRNWTGHDFGQANWYAYGRLAWNPGLTAEAIADEWIRMTWGHSPEVHTYVREMMFRSHEAIVDYSMPLGLHHLIGGNHYAPMPENDDPRRLDWSAIYYHNADAGGLGFDRTSKGSRAVEQYRSPLRERWNDPATVPESLLLWFHHRPWDHKMKSGRTLWEELVFHYRKGAKAARTFQSIWQVLASFIDAERHAAVAARLRQQAEDAEAWSEKCLRYFQQYSRRPLPEPAPGEATEAQRH